jgi:Transposase DDE domain
MNIQEYSLACVTSLESKKTTSAIAREVEVHQSTASRSLQSFDLEDTNFAKSMLAKLFGKRRLVCVIDETVLSKRYAEDTEGISFSIKDHSTKTYTNGYKISVGGLTDGRFFLPIYFDQWVSEDIIKNGYRTIIEMAKSLISKLLNLGIDIEYFVMDGSYCSKEFVHWLKKQRIKFVIKAKTTTSVIYNGEKMQLQNCPALRLNSNQRARTIDAEWDGEMWRFTAILRSGKRGPKIIYVISDFRTKSRIYAEIYDARWTIEKCFRTTKQYLGLKDSSSQYADTYLRHINCVFVAYTLMQLVMKKFKLESVEKAIRKTQALKNRYGFSQTLHRISLLAGYA